MCTERGEEKRGTTRENSRAFWERKLEKSKNKKNVTCPFLSHDDQHMDNNGKNVNSMCKT